MKKGKQPNNVPPSTKAAKRANKASLKKIPLLSAAAAYGKIVRTQNPDVSGSPFTGDGRTVITHREYIGEIAGSVDFAVTSYSINPGLIGTFPWTAAYPAPGYESYVFEELCFYFESEKSSSTNGSVMLAVDFDASDPPPASKTQLMAYHNAVRANVWMEAEYRASKADLTKFGVQRYIRTGALSSNQDVKTFDVGTFFIATQGCADTTKIGELYVEYRVILHTPQLDLSAQSLSRSAKIVSATSITDAAIFGTAPVITGGLLVTAAASTLTFAQVGQYYIEQFLTGTGLTTPTVTAGTAIETLLVGLVDATAITAIYGLTVNIVNPGETVVLDYSASTTVTACTTRISSYAYSLA